MLLADIDDANSRVFARFYEYEWTIPALGELGVELIPAHSPQAKGRMQRLFKPLEDRLVRELRLAGIDPLEAANQFVEKWRQRYNPRFTVQPDPATDRHRHRPAYRDLNRILCRKTTSCLRRD